MRKIAKSAEYIDKGPSANLLLNIGPDRSGHLPQPDKQNLLAFGQAIHTKKLEITFDKPKAVNAQLIYTPFF